MKPAAILLAVLALAACSTKASTGSLAPSSAAPSNTKASAAPAPSPPAFKVGDRVKTAAGNFATLHAFDPAVKSTSVFGSPSPGVTLVAADVELCAGPTAASYNPLYFKLRMADNTSADPDLMGQRAPSLSSGDLPANQCARGWVTFDVPAGATPAALLLASLTGGSVVTWSLT